MYLDKGDCIIRDGTVMNNTGKTLTEYCQTGLWFFFGSDG